MPRFVKGRSISRRWPGTLRWIPRAASTLPGTASRSCPTRRICASNPASLHRPQSTSDCVRAYFRYRHACQTAAWASPASRIRPRIRQSASRRRTCCRLLGAAAPRCGTTMQPDRGAPDVGIARLKKQDWFTAPRTITEPAGLARRILPVNPRRCRCGHALLTRAAAHATGSGMSVAPPTVSSIGGRRAERACVSCR